MPVPRLPDLIARWVEHLEEECGYSPYTVRGYRANLAECLAHLAQDLGRGEALQQWLNRLRNPKRGPDVRVSAATKQHKKAALRSFFGYLAARQVWPNNPALYLRTPRVPRRLPQFDAQADVERLLSAPLLGVDQPTIWQLQESAVLHLLYGAGLRCGEPPLLTLDMVRRDVPRPGLLSLRPIGKGNKERILPLPRRAAAALDRYLQRRSEIPGAAGKPMLFFSGRRRGVPHDQRPVPLSRRGVYRIVKVNAERAGLQGMWPYFAVFLDGPAIWIHVHVRVGQAEGPVQAAQDASGEGWETALHGSCLLSYRRVQLIRLCRAVTQIQTRQIR